MRFRDSCDCFGHKEERFFLFLRYCCFVRIRRFLSKMEKEFRISRFTDPQQWTTWEFTVRVMLKAGDVFEVVDGTERKPEGLVANLTKLQEWKKKDSKAQGIIVGSIGEKILLHILSCNTANEMWTKLNAVYAQKNETSISLLQERFFSYVKDSHDNMATHISRLETLYNKLIAMGVQTDKRLLLTKIILTLPSEYRYFSSAWDSTPLDKDKQTLENLSSRLLIEENRMFIQGEAERSEALLAKRRDASNAKQGGGVVLKLRARSGISSATNVAKSDTLDAIVRVRRQRKTRVTKGPTTKGKARLLFAKRIIDRAVMMGGTSTREPLITCVSSENGFANSLN